MATDMFGNILSPEEEERQRRHAEAMGMLPPALRIQMTSPFGGGIGPQSYQGSFYAPSVPDSLPLFADDNYYSENITPVPADVTVDPTTAGMAGVTQDYGPFSRSLGALSGMLAPAPSSSLPSYFDDPAVNEDMERLIAEEAVTKVDDFARITSQDPVASLGGWIRDVTKSVELPEIIDRTPRYTSPMPKLLPEDLKPQTGFTPVGLTTDAGMASVNDFFGDGDVSGDYGYVPGLWEPYSGEHDDGFKPGYWEDGVWYRGGKEAATEYFMSPWQAILGSSDVESGEPYSGMGDAPSIGETGHPGMRTTTPAPPGTETISDWFEATDPAISYDKIQADEDTRKAAPVAAPVAAPAQPAGPSAAEIARQNAINAQMAQEAAARQRQQQAAVAAEQARQAQAAQAAQEATRRSLEKQMQNWQGRDRQDESAMAQIQAALDHIADLQGTGITSGSTGDRSGEVRDAMRSVGYGGPEWT